MTDAEERRQLNREDSVDPEEGEDASHLDEVPDGSGCTEIWEHLSERRAEDGEDS